jgi:hypothetical protein
MDLATNRKFLVLQEEVDTAMRLLGVTRIDQLGPQYVPSTPHCHLPIFLFSFPVGRSACSGLWGERLIESS